MNFFKSVIQVIIYKKKNMKFKCCFYADFKEEDTKWWECDSSFNDPDDAAEQFADYVHHYKDGWEFSDYWDDGDSVVVYDVKNNKLYRFEIEREHVPSFHAVDTKQDMFIDEWQIWMDKVGAERGTIEDLRNI